jgi:DNA-binding MarR family transcriptional regulator
VPNSATPPAVLLDVERLVVASVGITARALGEVAPDLTLVQWRVVVLVDVAGSIAIGALAAALDSKIAAISRLVSRLRRRGLVETHRGDEDARVVLVSLTEQGRDLRRRVVERRRDDLRRAIDAADLPAEATIVVDRLAAVLERVA